MIEKLKQLFRLEKAVEPTVLEKIDEMFANLKEDTLGIRIGEDLVSFGMDICEMVGDIRSEMVNNTGFILPPVHIFSDETLQENQYVIQVLDEDMCHGFAVPNKEGLKEISLKFKEIILDNIEKVLTNEVAEKYIDTAQKTNGWLIWALCGRVTSPEIKIILVDILKSGHSIKNISHIFEKIGNKILVNNKYYESDPHKISHDIIKEL